ncbi:MAG TPA: VWA domain-containing protein [Vicinamibacterales bacterium]|nr:VWA domain-containing protein [Vicinamibacterales bacterium]
MPAARRLVVSILAAAVFAALPAADYAEHAAPPAADYAEHAAPPAADHAEHAALPAADYAEHAALPAADYAEHAAPPAADHAEHAALPAADYAEHAAPSAADYAEDAAPPAADYAEHAAPPAADYAEHTESQTPQKKPVFRANTQLVSVDVIARDAQGNVVRGLTAADFEVTEDGKPQEIRSFSFQEIKDKPAGIETADLLGAAKEKLAEETRRTPAGEGRRESPRSADPSEVKPMTSEQLAGRRLIILLFDISSMQPEDVQRAVDSASTFVDKNMTPADMVAVATISSRLDVLSDLSSDKTKVSAALAQLGYKEGTATPPPTADTVATDEQLSQDDTSAQDTADMDMFNNDIRLRALKALAETLTSIEQTKSIMYFSAGMQRSGEDNQVELRSAINAAVRAHVKIYPVDTRGLQAIAPGGDASRQSGRGSSLFSGANVRQQFAQLNASQDTLGSLASDTGGRAFLDSNDFAPAFERVQRDMSAYYLIGYATSNLAKDGRFRTIKVRVKKPSVKVEARGGYYADRDFQHTARADRETQLQEQLFSAVSATDLPVLVTASFFRLAADRYFVPIAVAVPGSAIPVPADKDKDKLVLDVLGMVRDERGMPVGRIRQTMPLPAGSTGTVASKQILYQSPVTLPPGRFSVKVVVRENTSGLMGSFEAPVTVPELKQAALKVSSVLLSTQLQPAKETRDNPLIRNGEQLIPNLTHIVGKDQKMFFYYEVYDPATETQPDVRTSLAFYRGKVKVYETPVVERAQIDDPSRKAAVFQLEVPAGSLAPGFYTCQINIIDSIAGKFAFPRLVFLLR